MRVSLVLTCGDREIGTVELPAQRWPGNLVTLNHRRYECIDVHYVDRRLGSAEVIPVAKEKPSK